MIGALLLGVVAGLRTLTAPAVLLLLRRGGPPAYGLGLLALLEYGADLYPGAPARTSGGGLVARLLSGAFCGWTITAAKAPPPPALNAVLGVCGAVLGAYLGLAVRTRAISVIGSVPAALAEDGAAIAGAILVVTYA